MESINKLHIINDHKTFTINDNKTLCNKDIIHYKYHCFYIYEVIEYYRMFKDSYRKCEECFSHPRFLLKLLEYTNEISK